MKRKLFLLLCTLLTSVGMWAQADVTSMYLTNANFDAGEESGWTYRTSSGTHYHGALDYGSDAKINGIGMITVDKFGGTSGKAFITAAGWGTASYYTQDVTLPAGTYKITFDVFNNRETTGGTSRLGWVPEGSTAVYSSQEFTYDLWVTHSVTFTLAASTSGKISVGITSVSGKGSGDCAHLIIDNVKIFKMDATPAATTDNPIDYSDLINQKTWSYSEDDGSGSASSLTTNVNKGDFPYRHAERYRGVAGHYGKKLYQTIENLPAGVYQVKASCMSAAANGKEGASALADGTMNNAFFYANDKQTTYPLNNATSKFMSQTIDVKKNNGSIEFGVKTIAVGANWSAIGCATLLKVGDLEQIDDIATNFTNGSSATADTWYKLTGTVETAVYKVSGTVGTVITYTTDGKDAVSRDDFPTATIGVNGYVCILLSSGSLCFKTDVTSNITAENVTTTAIDAGTYYLKNVANNQFLAAGKTYGTHTITNVEGLDLKFAKSGNGYTIDTQISNGGNNQYLNGLYCDGASSVFYLIDLGSSKYALTSDGNHLIASNGNNNECVHTEDLSDTKAQWQFVTRDSRIVSLSSATKANPVDVTFIIKGGNFSRNDLRNKNWTMVASNQNLSGGNDNNRCAESYHSTFTLSQTLSDLPSGTYGMTAQGFYRQDGSDNEHLPYFYINGATIAEKTFPVKTGSENSMSDASTSFTEGKYIIDEIRAGVTHQLPTIGVKLETNTNLWCIFDNFRLKYYGPNLYSTAEKLTRGGTMTANKWYYIDLDGTYTMTAGSNLSNIVVTNDGTILVEDEGTVTDVLANGDFTGRYYVKSSSEQTLSWTCTSKGIIDNGTYYFKAVNDESGRDAFLTRGGNWGAEAISEVYGIAFIATHELDGGYSLKNEDHSLAANANKYLNTGYTDGNSAYDWFLEDAGDNYYYLKSTALDYLKMDILSGEYERPYGFMAFTTYPEEATKWQLMTKSEYDTHIASRSNSEAAAIATAAGLEGITTQAQLVTALESAPYSSVSTSKITNAAMTVNTAGWTLVNFSSHTGSCGADNNACEVYNGSQGYKQTISGLAEGIYKVTLQGLFRLGGNGDPSTRVGNSSNVTAFVSANTGSQSNMVQLKKWSDYDGEKPTNRSTFAKVASNYTNTLYVYVGKGESLTLMVGMFGDGNSSSWMPFMNWTLTHYVFSTSATIGENGFATFASEYPLDMTIANMPDGVRAYKGSLSGNVLSFTKLNQKVPKNTGVLLVSTDELKGQTVNIPVVASGDAVSGNVFEAGTGAVLPKDNDNYYYALSKSHSNLTFGTFDQTKVIINANKAYFKVAQSAGARLVISFEDENPNTINAIEAADTKAEGLKDGKYLVNGKIVLVKNGVKFNANGQILK